MHARLKLYQPILILAKLVSKKSGHWSLKWYHIHIQLLCQRHARLKIGPGWFHLVDTAESKCRTVRVRACVRVCVYQTGRQWGTPLNASRPQCNESLEKPLCVWVGQQRFEGGAKFPRSKIPAKQKYLDTTVIPSPSMIANARAKKLQHCASNKQNVPERRFLVLKSKTAAGHCFFLQCKLAWSVQTSSGCFVLNSAP